MAGEVYKWGGGGGGGWGLIIGFCWRYRGLYQGKRISEGGGEGSYKRQFTVSE